MLHFLSFTYFLVLILLKQCALNPCYLPKIMVGINRQYQNLKKKVAPVFKKLITYSNTAMTEKFYICTV